MNKRKKLFSHLRQKENKRLRNNWQYLHKWRNVFDPKFFSTMCDCSCLNCKHCVLDDKMNVYCTENERMIGVRHYACSCHEPSKVDMLEKGHSYFDIEAYEP